MKKISLILLTLLLHAKDGERLFNQHGCYGCHGNSGKGTPGYPILSGKPKKYLIKKLKSYKEGNTTTNKAAIMIPFAKALSDKEIEAIADYLSKPKNQKEEIYDPEYEPTDFI